VRQLYLKRHSNLLYDLIHQVKEAVHFFTPFRLIIPPERGLNDLSGIFLSHID
jgi:hypothetical protein